MVAPGDEADLIIRAIYYVGPGGADPASLSAKWTRATGNTSSGAEISFEWVRNPVGFGIKHLQANGPGTPPGLAPGDLSCDASSDNRTLTCSITILDQARIALTVLPGDYTFKILTASPFTYTAVVDGADAGTSTPSINDIPNQVLTIKSVPGAPANLTARHTAAGEVTLAWGELAAYPAVTRYEYRYKQTGSNWLGWTDNTDTDATVSPLSDDTSYEFQVRAVNAEGAGPASDITLTKHSKGWIWANGFNPNPVAAGTNADLT